MVNPKRSRPTTSAPRDLHMTPCPVTPFDGDLHSFETPDAPLRNSADPNRSNPTSKLPFSVSLPVLACPKGSGFGRGIQGVGTRKSLEQAPIPTLKLTPRRSGSRGKTQLGLQF